MSYQFNRLVCAIATLGAVTACTTLSSESRVASPLRASEFNDVASQYMERPTFVAVQAFSDGNVALKVRVDEYGTGYDPQLGVATEHATFFDKRYVANYLPFIDKYLEWEAQASQRGDQIEKEIGTAKTWGSAGDIDLRFKFYSASPERHFLIVERCAFGTCLGKTLDLSKENATVLRKLLVDFAAGKVGLTDASSAYQ